MRWAWEEESAWFGGDGGGLQGEGATGAQASRQLGPEHVSSNQGKLGVGWGMVHGARHVCTAYVEATWTSHTDTARGMGALQARAAELALGLRALVFTTPTPASPPRPRPQPSYSFCCSEAWSLQENMGPPEPGFSVMF